MENVIAVLAALVVAALMIWPIWMGVYDPEERGRCAFTCAIATSVWTWWYLAHIDGMTWAATTLVIFALGLPASCPRPASPRCLARVVALPDKQEVSPVLRRAPDSASAYRLPRLPGGRDCI